MLTNISFYCAKVWNGKTFSLAELNIDRNESSNFFWVWRYAQDDYRLNRININNEGVHIMICNRFNTILYTFTRFQYFSKGN